MNKITYPFTINKKSPTTYSLDINIIFINIIIYSCVPLSNISKFKQTIHKIDPFAFTFFDESKYILSNQQHLASISIKVNTMSTKKLISYILNTSIFTIITINRTV